METQYELFNDLKKSGLMQERLYYWKEAIGFNEIMAKIPNDLLEVIDGYMWRQFEWGLKYVYPLIEEGKLKARIAKKVECEIMPDGIPRYTTLLWGEYGKGQGKEFVQDAERYYKKCENDDMRINFEMWSILFTLPENEWGEY